MFDYLVSHDMRDTQVNGLRRFHDYPVLGVLVESPGHGYDLNQKLNRRLGDIWRLGLSHIYAVLAGLEQAALVRHYEVKQDTRPSKKVFHITEDGRLLFLKWVSSPVIHMRDIRLEFLAKLHFSRLNSHSAMLDLIKLQLCVCEDLMRHLQFQHQESMHAHSDVATAKASYRLKIVEATISWLEQMLT